MLINEFMQETDKLEKFYNKEMDQYEKNVWFQELKYLPLKRYEQLVKKAFTECKFMPKLADIIEINKNLPYNVVNKITQEKVECNKCNGLGVIRYYKVIEDKPYEYFARCTCKNGEEFKYDGTKISDVKHRSKFFIPSIEQVGLGG